jgi:hypothetical protein
MLDYLMDESNKEIFFDLLNKSENGELKPILYEYNE